MHIEATVYRPAIVYLLERLNYDKLYILEEQQMQTQYCIGKRLL